MYMKKERLNLLMIILIMFSYAIFSPINKTEAIYREIKSTSLSLSVLDPSSTYRVTLNYNDGTGYSEIIFKSFNEAMGNDLITPTRTNYNFMGWYDENDRRIYSDEQITGNVTFHAVWSKIVCKKVTSVNNLHAETCSGSNGCLVSGVGYSSTDTIRYGSIFGTDSPVAGDAYDCDVYYNSNSDTFDDTDGYGKHIERFYFVREKENSGSENTAVLIYYTSFDDNGRVDTQHTSQSDIDSDHYNTALTWLPTSSDWENPKLIDFDGNGKVSRFLSKEDLETMCRQQFADSNTAANSTYFANCLNNMSQNGTVNGKNWFIFENSKFQSSSLASDGIWLETDGTYYYQIQTSTVEINRMNTGNTSDNIARPVIEIPMSTLDGYVNLNRYRIDFDSHEGSDVSEDRYIYDGKMLGMLPTTTRPHYNFDDWYSNYAEGVYSNPVTASTIVYSNMTLHAKWIAKPTCAVTLNLNGGTGVDSSMVVDIGDLYDPGTPTKADSTFFGWYTDQNLTTPYDSSTAISTSTLSLWAKWISADAAVSVEGVGYYTTLAEAIENVPVGASAKTRVIILKDITINDTVTIPADKWVELDGGNNTISGTVGLISNSGKLDIISGTLTTTGINVINNVSGAILNVSGGTLRNTGSDASNNVIENNGATANITGGYFVSSSQGAVINNRYSINSILNISGGRIIGTNTTKGQGIYIEKGTTTISGDVYIENISASSGKDARAAVDNNGGTLIITGGTIVSTQNNAVANRASSSITTIGSSSDLIDITTPVLRGKLYGLDRTNGTANIYDGFFESLDNTRAIHGTIADKPNGIDFVDSIVDVDNETYYSTYLFVPQLTVTFYPENGNNDISVTVDNGDEISANNMPGIQTKTNYLFAGWFAGSTEITANTVVTTYINAYAKWVKSISTATIDNTLSVEKDSSETIEITGTDLEDVIFSSSDTSIATVDSSGHVTGVNAGTATITITGTTSSDTRTVTVTVTPIIREIRFYRFDTDSTPTYILTVVDGSSIDNTPNVTMPYTPIYTNYAFNGWVIEANNNLIPFTSATQVTGDIDVIATWVPNIQNVTIHSSLNVTINSTNTIYITNRPNNVENYTFSSANNNIATVVDDGNGNGTVTGISLGTVNIIITGTSSNITRIVTVNVVSEPVSSRRVIFYDTDGVTELYSRIVNDGSSLDFEMPPNPTKENHIFDTWYIDGTMSEFTSSTVIENGNVDVVASWKEYITLATITTNPSPLKLLVGTQGQININASNAGNSVESYTIVSSNPNYISLVGNTLYAEAVSNGPITLTITGSESHLSTTITAEVADKYEVIFENDGVEYDTMNVTPNTALDSLPTPPTKSGYVFVGWYVENIEPYNNRVDETTIIDSNKRYYARWASNTYQAEMNNTLYATMQDALNAAPTGTKTTIRLLKNVTYTKMINLYDTSNSTPAENQTKNIVFDLNGFTITNNSTYTFRTKTAIEIKNGNIVGSASSGAIEANDADASIKIYDVNITISGARQAIYNAGGTIEIYGNSNISAKAQVQSTNRRGTIQNNSGTLRIYGGNITTTATGTAEGIGLRVEAGTVELYDCNIDAVSATTTGATYGIYVTGGTLKIGESDGIHDTSRITIKGKTNGVYASQNIQFYDGYIMAVSNNAAINNESNITSYETGATKTNDTETISGVTYNRLYYSF